MSISVDTPGLKDEVAKALIAADAISEVELPDLEGDSLGLAMEFGSIILGLDGVMQFVDQLAEVGERIMALLLLIVSISAAPNCHRRLECGIDRL